MLTVLDDSLWHQIPTTFDHVGTSDPRFFDRFWFAFYEPEGRGAAQFTLGAYSNMNVLDGGVVAIHEGRQHNLRVSRSLRPRFEPNCGPLRVEVEEPLQRFRLLVGPGEQSIACDLTWNGVLPVEEESPHFARARGRVAQEYQRFNQVGEVSGWLQLGDTRLELDRWWACRDHSWGVRPSMGIPEPATGPTAPTGQSGSLFCFLFFSTDTLAGHVQVAEQSGGRTYLTGIVRDRRDHDLPDLVVADLALGLQFYEGTRRVRQLSGQVTLADGRRIELTADALGPSIAMPGLGYSGGFNDGRGLGVWRGEEWQEHEIWDVQHQVDVITPSGEVRRPVHRIQPVRLRSSGSGFDGSGAGSLTLIASGSLPRYGLSG